MPEEVKPTPKPSLSDLDKTDTGIKSGDGNPTPADLAAKAEADKLAAEKKQAEDAAARIETLKAKPADQLTEAEKKELADATPAGEEPKEDGDTDEEEGNFWDDVDALRGTKLEIDWSKHKDDQGNEIDPTSPQGAYIREQYIAQQAVASFEEHIAKTDPRGYAYILHRQAGGTDEDFFSRKTVTLPEYDKFKESVDLQSKVYRDDLLRKGLDADSAKVLVDKAVTDKKIFELADKAYKDYDKSQKDELAQVTKKLEDEDKAYQKSVAELSTLITNTISGDTMRFLVPDAKKADFDKFVRTHIQRDGDQFFAVQALDKDSIGKTLEALYFRFINGDLKSLIQRTAVTQNSKRLQRAAQKSEKTPAGGGTGGASGKKTLGEI